MANMLMELAGITAHLEVYDDKLILRRTKSTAKFSGDKTIYLNQITGVAFKKAGTLFSGYIEFSIPGSVSSNSIQQAVHSENSVIFRKNLNDAAEEIKNNIEALIEKQSKSNNNQSKSIDPDILRKYKQLLDDGIISKDDFEAKKKEILGL